MEARVLECAARGLQLHFGTDHDHIVDYRPIVRALGLDDVLVSVVADEVSPTLRGHHNIYPATPDPSAPNGGAYLWWTSIPRSTTELFETIRAQQPGVRVQANHPLGLSGELTNAGWTPGRIAHPDHFYPDNDAIEVANAGNLGDLPALYLDLSSRGVIFAPVAVSDSHGPGAGGIGVNATFFGVGVDDLGDYSDDRLRDAIDAHRTIASRGPFLDLSIPPGSTVQGPTDLRVVARSPSWIVVDRLRLYRDAEEIEVVEGAEATFRLAPEKDAAYVVVAEGDRPMRPVSSATPWALSSAILVDVDGNGWTPGLPPLQLGD
jgi:hypothetical protein